MFRVTCLPSCLKIRRPKIYTAYANMKKNQVEKYYNCILIQIQAV